VPWDSIDRRRDEDELAPLPGELSAREVEVLQMLANVGTTAKAAQALHLSEWTIRSHFKRILPKLGARNRAHAIAIGFRAKLIR
jgi:DNA-binding NarL/FixJ family response regulator